MKKVHDLIILGSGPAGWTAALYAARAGLKPLVITGSSIGGQLMTTTNVDNWPGQFNDLLGPDLMSKMQEHAVHFGAEVIIDEVMETNFLSSPFSLKGNKDYYAKSVIICTGANAKYLDLPSEQQFLGKGVSGCATCDGFFYRNEEVAVVGGGASAVEEALYLSSIAKKVHMIHRKESFKAESIMIDKLYEKVKQEKIALHLNATVQEILGDEKGVHSVEILQNDKKKVILVNGVFIAIGHTPNTKIFIPQISLNEQNYIVTGTVEHYKTQTNIAGIFAAGDVQDDRYRQAITSAGTGCQAALDAIAFLQQK